MLYPQTMFPDGVLKVPFFDAVVVNVYECSRLRKNPAPLGLVQRNPVVRDSQAKPPPDQDVRYAITFAFGS
jgi:hypothetical protein